ncbi:MAG TPA: putative molybdenum carrier protein [Azoarcus taiwanensis]|nr:putative molybdenum carrier protein [Azoarcus taiwanensis]
MNPARIVSGGQAGADRAALDWAIAHRIAHGGWCPSGRLAEDGRIHDRYQLVEVPEGGGYRRRTKANVRDSDATLLITIDPVLTGGSKETALFAKRLAKPWLHVHPESAWRNELTQWLGTHPIETLNVAGPRLSRSPEVVAFTWMVLDAVLEIMVATTACEPQGSGEHIVKSDL